MQPQTLRRKINTQRYEEIASNKRSFDVRLDNEDIQPDDYYCFIEMVEDTPNREVWRRVAVVERVAADTAAPGFAVVGLVPAEYQALEGVFADGGIIVGYAIEKNETDIQLIDGPMYLPPLMTSGVSPHQMNDFLGVRLWPSGQYSIMARCKPGEVDAGQQSVMIEEKLIACRTLQVVKEEELDLFITVDYRFLLVGALKDLFGNPVSAHIGLVDSDDEDDEPLTAEDTGEEKELEDEEQEDEDG